MIVNPYSKQILKYIQKIPDFSHYKKFSKKTILLFTRFLEKIQVSDIAYTNANIIKINSLDYKQSDLYNAIPIQIRNIIENQQIIQESYQFSIADRNIKLHFIIPSSSPHSIKTINISIKLVYTWFYFISQYSSNPKCASSLDLYLHMINHNKVLPINHGEPIEQIHANTAFTWACVENSTIQIFREEEWFKVLIHESFHTLGLDFSTMDISECQKKIKEWFSISTEGLLFESYCETWACILNIVFLSFYSKNTTKKQLESIENLIQLETKYAFFQSVKVLQHYNLTYKDLVFKTPDTIKQREQYSEKTNVFCYNILKGLMIYNLDDFLQWCIINNRNVLEFHKTYSKIENFCKWIENHYKTSDFMKDYKHTEHWYNSSPKRGYIYNTMRMTIFG